MAELKNYTPSWRQRVQYALADLMGGDRQAHEDANRGVGLVGSLIPPFEAVLQGNEAVREAQGGRYGQAAGHAGLAALNVAPFAAISARKASMPGKYDPIPGTPKEFKLPDGEVLPAKPIREVVDAAEAWMGPGHRPQSFPKLDESRATRIAGEFDAAKHAPNDPMTKESYEQMARETLGQYDALVNQGLDFRFMKRGPDGQVIDPYAKSPAMGYKDLAENKRLEIFPTDAGFGSSNLDTSANPLLAQSGRKFGDQDATYNDLFRAVHDAYGHFGHGNPFFRAPGEERAWALHSGMYSPEARRAMTSETRGQNSWVNYGPHGAGNRKASGADTVYADQKTTLLPEWVSTEGASPFTRPSIMDAMTPLQPLPPFAQGE